MNDDVFELPGDWTKVKQAINDLLARRANASVQAFLDQCEASQGIDSDAFVLLVEGIVDQIEAGSAEPEVLLAVAGLASVPGSAFRGRPRAWRSCCEAAAKQPTAFFERSFVLYEDLLYNYYYHELSHNLAEAGIAALIGYVCETTFLREKDVGTRVAQNVLLALVRERQIVEVAALQALADAFPEMRALQKKVEERIKGG